MKLLCINQGYWPAVKYGGPVFSTHELYKMLVKKGIDVTVYAINVGQKIKLPENQEVNVDGVKVVYFSFFRFLEFIGPSGWQFSVKLTRALKKNIRNFDIVHINSIWNYPVAAAAYYCRKYQRPYLVSPRGSLSYLLLGKKFLKKMLYYFLVIRKYLRGASAIHYATAEEMKACHSALGFKNKAVIVANGIDLSKFSDLPGRENLKQDYPILEGKKVLLFLSRINWNKGLDILIKAYCLLAKERADLHLLIAGNDDQGYAKKVKRWIRNSGIEKRVTFTGMLTGQKKLEAYRGSDVFILPSYSESFGMAVVEAMACGLPVVISNKVGIYRQLQENKAGVVVEGNAKSLYQGIKSILGNDKFSQELSANGRETVEKYYDIEKVADKMIAAYREVLNK